IRLRGAGRSAGQLLPVRHLRGENLFNRDDGASAYRRTDDARRLRAVLSHGCRDRRGHGLYVLGCGQIMSDTRLNGIIRALESGKPAFTCFAKLDRQTAIEMTDSPYDGVVYEMEHNPYDVTALGDCLQYMLNRKAIAASGSVAPSVTPIARIPANGVEMNQ